MKKTVPTFRFLNRSKECLVIAGAFLLGTAISPAASVTLKADDAAGTTSFTGSSNWNPTGVPAPGNSYFTGAHVIRSVNNTTTGKTNIFGGDSLSLDAGSRFLGKVGNNAAGNTTVATHTANYILNGGLMDQAGANNDSSVCVIDGTVTVTAASQLGAFGATSSGSANFETLDIIAPISGNGALQVSGANVNAGADTGVVRLSAANPYGGIITVTNANNNVVASAVQRLLQLNNLNALSNATVNLVATVINPMSFANAVNGAAFDLGGLSGTSSQILSDTAGNAVTLNLGGNGTSSVFNGGLTGNGSLMKVGTGTLALSGENTFSGVTIISDGTLAMSGHGSLASSINITATNATLDVSGLNSSSLTVATGKTLSGIGLVNGSITMSPSSAFAPGNHGLGTLTISANLTLNNASSNLFALSPSAGNANGLALVGGTLTCNHSLIYLNATGGATSLDTSSDYVLFQATNGINGVCAATPVFLGPLPANASHYTVITSGNTVVLHYNIHTPPAAVTTASPASLTWGQSTCVKVTTANGDAAVMSVTLDASAIGGSSSMTMVLDGTTSNTWTNTVTANASAGAGDRTLTATVTDANGLSSSSSVSLAVMPPSLAIQNPILPSHHADPFIGYFAGKYWIYPTSEDTKSFRAFASTNLVDWVDQGEVFNLSQSSWATNGYGWAPCVVYFQGSYYFYYAMGGAAGWQDSKIGVAVGPSPAGPFTDSGASLVSSQTSSPHVEAIDPMIFMDTDGKAYLYYGGSGGANLGIRQLNTNDLISFSGPLNVVTPANFTEAAFMSKRNGLYYISYSNGNWQTNTYNVRYATANSPLGPWTYRGPILTSDSLHKGPGSHAFLQIPDTDIWYICYHYWDSVYSTRHVALDSLNYNPDGTLKPVTMTGGGTVARWESYSVPGYYIVHTNSIAKLVNSDWTDVTSQFLMVPGLADKSPNAVSFELIDKADRYLRQNSSGQIVMDLWTAGGTFNADATFYLRPGLADSNGVSFESSRSPGHYIRQINASLYSQPASGPTFASDATWKSWTASTLSDLQIAPTNGQRAIISWNATWNGDGTLLEATNLSGPWTTNSSAGSPLVVPATNAAKFYKIEP